MHHHRQDANLLEQHHVTSEALGQGLVTHSVTTEFDDEGLTREAPHIGQRLRQRGGGLQARLKRVRVSHLVNLEPLKI